MQLDPRIPASFSPPAAGAPTRCALCDSPYRQAPDRRYPQLCSHTCIRFVALWKRRLSGLCPWCEQLPDGPHTAAHCVPGFDAKPGRKGNQCAQCHRAVEGGGAHSPNCSLAIFERHGWVCTLCDGPIDPLLPARHPWGPTLDHHLPESRGGGRGAENLRAAHRICNEQRGAPEPS